MNMKKRVKLLILGIAVLLFAAFVIYITFFYSKSCPDITCFNTALSQCIRRSYIEDTENAVWLYSIQGKSGGDCVVGVKLAQLKQGSMSIASLEGEEMTCYIQLGVVITPRDNLDKCHGILKEDMQGLIINNLHKYITDNLGKIGEALEKPL